MKNLSTHFLPIIIFLKEQKEKAIVLTALGSILLTSSFGRVRPVLAAGANGQTNITLALGEPVKPPKVAKGQIGYTGKIIKKFDVTRFVMSVESFTTSKGTKKLNGVSGSGKSGRDAVNLGLWF